MKTTITRSLLGNLFLISIVLLLGGATACRDERDHRIESFRKKYAGTIRTDLHGADIASSVQQMDKLMAEWNPVGYRRAHIETLLGKPTEATRDAIVYRFDSGLGGWQWRFDLEKDVVTRVEKSAID